MAIFQTFFVVFAVGLGQSVQLDARQSAMAKLEHSLKDVEGNYSFNGIEFFGRRIARSLRQLGEAAVRVLLRGAEKSKSQGIGFVTYEKKGSYKDAVSEFYGVHPVAVKQKLWKNRLQTIGMVGDRSIRLAEDKGVGGPALLISNPVTGGVEYKIIYKMKLD